MSSKRRPGKPRHSKTGRLIARSFEELGHERFRRALLGEGEGDAPGPESTPPTPRYGRGRKR